MAGTLPLAPGETTTTAIRTRRALMVLGLLALPVVAYLGFVLLGLPARAEVRALAQKNPGTTAVMRQRAQEAARAGRPLRRAQAWVPISRISRNLIHAVVIAEDPKFFGHVGIDWDAVRESAERDIREHRFVRGGSTITQQLAKNLFFTTHKSVARKVRETIVARWLEADLKKARILELYLNVVEWGDGVYGCEAAAHRYYDTSAADLDEDQAAGLAGMIPSPRRINPGLNPRSFAQAQRRILRLMAHAGYVKRDVGTLGAEPSVPFWRRLFGGGPREPEEPGADSEPEADPQPAPEPPASQASPGVR